jgi:hypothetical protein
MKESTVQWNQRINQILAGQQAAAAAAAVAAAASRWQVVDEEAEKQTAPQVPISKWLQEEAAAEEARKV